MKFIIFIICFLKLNPKCRMYNMPNYTYFQTPQSNETSQTYFLERTQSARLTLEKALRILPQNMSSIGGNNNSSAMNMENNEVSYKRQH